ncbi:PQ-loop-domain-containing protein [Ascobolus immersus RN42]|uniref:PQ-loop-domain-containing protein n=1 Tax=Ascobolus immersus RN42 TaxID=1160509 RepID=A0A3N4IJR7_ASCIM|nr:PQ-loop-domain-containing protein [Ascobolus immersus RN42]
MDASEAWATVLINSDNDLVVLAKALSRLIGWTYFCCWSFSFYPQLWKNYQRKAVTGLSVDFATVNVFGFAFYTIYTTLLLLSPTIRAQYAARHPLSPEPTVRWNDFAFGVHALLLSFICWTQLYFWGYTRSSKQVLSVTMRGIIVGCFAAVGLVATFAWAELPGWELLDVVYAFSYAKLAITVVKYTPQAYINYKRQSTVGWSIHNILFDLAGGILSLAQLLLDSSMNGDWSGVTGNPVKFWLGLTTLGYDGLFCVQHYILYKGRAGVVLEGEGDDSSDSDDGDSVVQSYGTSGKKKAADLESGEGRAAIGPTGSSSSSSNPESSPLLKNKA